MYFNHLMKQGPVVGGMLRLVRAGKGAALPELPGPEFTETVPPRSAAMVRDYVRFVGGDPKAYRGHLPPHLFAQWGFPLYARALEGLPYDLKKVVNAGFRYQVNAPLPADEPLQLSSRLTSVDDDGRRALLELTLTTGTASAPDALVSTLVVFVPSGKNGKKSKTGKKGPSKPKPVVPQGAREIGGREVGRWSGLVFAQLTGDVNPLHWLPPYAKLSGFKGVILHGFCTAAIAAECLNSGLFAGDVSRITGFEARFTRPLLLPRRVRVFVDDGDSGSAEPGADPSARGVYVGENPGGPAYLTGAFTHVR